MLRLEELSIIGAEKPIKLELFTVMVQLMLDSRR